MRLTQKWGLLLLGILLILNGLHTLCRLFASISLPVFLEFTAILSLAAGIMLLMDR
jgi:hypothetical protein